MKHLVVEINGKLENVSLSTAEYEELISLVERAGVLLRAVGIKVEITVLSD